MVRIAFATDKGGLDDEIYTRFGRTPTFTIVDVENGKIKNVKVIENPAAKGGSGAGIKSVQKLAEEGVEIVVGPNPGPNATMALQQAGIKVVVMLGVTVREALKNLIEQGVA
jgi:predicted Fe-Mo cluster-binding NifX family protein